jgi:hypothetical protein
LLGKRQQKTALDQASQGTNTTLASTIINKLEEEIISLTFSKVNHSQQGLLKK